MLALRELQARFFAALTQQGGAGESTALAGAIAASPTLDAEARLEIYRDMYATRLLEVLAEDFPATARVLGAKRFAAQGRRYVARHRSTHPSLRFFGAAFPDMLARARVTRAQPWVADLARLEWARLSVFDAPDPQPLTATSLREVEPAAWGTLTFRLIAAYTTLESAWPVHELWSRVTPTEGGTPPPAVRDPPLAPRATSLRVWRQGTTVYQASMEAPEREALALVATGASFAAVCDRVAEHVEAEDAAAHAGGLLLRWLEDGILAPGVAAAAT